MKVIFENTNYSFKNMKSYLYTHLRVVHVVLIAGESILGPSLTSLERRLFGRSGIMGLKIQNNFLIPIWEIQVGSRALVTLRHSFSHFDQIHIVLGATMVNPEWRWFLKRKILHLQILNHIWIHIWELYTWFWWRAKTCSSWAPLSQLRVILGQSLTNLERRLFGRSGIMGLKI